MPQSIRLLLIEDNSIEARQTQRRLEIAGGGLFQVEWIERMALGLDRLARGGIDIVLLDLNLPDSQGLETFAKIHAQAADIPIVVLTGEDDETLGASAVENGAQDYLVKQQVDGAKLARVLRYALARRRAQERQTKKWQPGEPARVIGFLGAKGGVGTTTVALNVALALAQQQKSVILTEMRSSFGTLAHELRQEPQQGLRTLLDHFPERIGEQDVNALLYHGPAGLRILFGPRQMDGFKEVDPGQGEAVVKALSTMAEFVILDLPSQPSLATQAAVCLCNFIAVVTERELGSVISAKVALNQLQSWGVRSGFAGAVVVNRTESPSPMKLTEIRSRLGCECFQSPQASGPGVSSMTDHAAAGFVEIASGLATDNLVGMNF